ncbi:hypothetical protein [Janthinobacterium lividum]|uniref:hypothetical protein n=1 Tax=Janthinobacterium lividum TaxID=29581 RepID=UPI000FE25ADF|nr:hypothetical protein [Janthinobacterium lividum]
MNTDEYRFAKVRTGITVPDIWYGVTKMTKDQDKAYSSGRTVIPDIIATKVRTVMEYLENCGKKLADDISKALPDCTVSFNDSTGTIMLTFPSKKSIVIDCAGVDTTNHAPVYVAARSTKSEAIFIFFDDKSPARPNYIPGNQWFLWRGDFPENRHMSQFQNYFNKIGEQLLTSAFRAYA